MTEEFMDFEGYATRNNLKCTDGRTILAGAFEHQDGMEVPLVWQHGIHDPENILGKVKLKNVADGVRAIASFNNTPQGQNAKELVRHGDIKFLSIFAKELVERSKQVLKGNIKEVSLVVAGANPGAVIDNVAIAHSDGEVEVYDDEAVITTGLEIEVGGEVSHSEVDVENEETDEGALQHEDERTLEDILNTLNEEQEVAVNFLLSQAFSGNESLAHSDEDGESLGDAESEDDGESGEESGEEEASEEVDADSEADEESADEEDGNEDTETGDESGSETETGDESGEDAGDGSVQHSDINQEDNSMTHNVFEGNGAGAGAGTQQATLSHSDIKEIVGDLDRTGSLRRSLQDYVERKGVQVNGELKHGIENIEYLFPDAKLLENTPNFVQRRVEWVEKVLNGVRKTPFSRIKTVTADITADEARARGYIKGNEKVEEFFTLIKRETTPQTIYKKQKLDRDDVLDITELDVIAWVKAEMKMMLDEEIAGAILVGDGRSSGDPDKIKTDKIRPIASDAELYVTTAYVNLDDSNSTIEELTDAVIANRKYFKGTGMPAFFTNEDVVGKYLTVKDNFGRRIYNDLSGVSTALRVSEIIPVEVLSRDASVVGIMVNLADYSVGTDRGGQATMFDDFDLDFNKLIYLLETRLCGALTLPKSAIVFRKVAAGDALVVPLAPTFVSNTVTVPTVSGVTYKDGLGNTLTTGSPVELEEGEELDVKAFPNAGKYFANDAEDEWHYEYDPDA
jgi:HK97 family phage prohead protease